MLIFTSRGEFAHWLVGLSMCHIKTSGLGGVLLFFLGCLLRLDVSAADAAASARAQIVDISLTPSQQVIRVAPVAGAEQFRILRTDSLEEPFKEDATGLFSGYDWVANWSGKGPIGFYKAEVVPLDPKAVLAATVLNRLSYGPTPDEIDRINAIGPEAYIAEQLAPEKIEESLEFAAVASGSDWRFVTATGRASSSTLYIYLDVAGEGYIDDLKLVRGTVAEAGANLIPAGDFDAALGTEWTIASNMSGSGVVTDVKRTGAGALRLAASSGGTTASSAIVYQVSPALSSSTQYTLSFWYKPSTRSLSSVTVRLSGSGIVATSGETLGTKLAYGIARSADLQAWYILHAVQSRRQLLEVMSQFVDNHFTTYYTKTREYMDGLVRNDVDELIATELEFRELSKWRQVLLDPNGTFYDLLKISAESPAMIIYLDTVTSKAGAANENYARELMELFTMGVDNGYDQNDIEELSRAWTGWRVEKLPLSQKENPFASPVQNRDTMEGYWTMRFSQSSHDTTAKTIFPKKTVDERFGPPHAGRLYELRLPARSGTAGIRDGYDVIAHLADLPYTQEYISVKLCQWFVHENFVHGAYDYRGDDISEEAKLIRECMRAWETPAADGRKGNLRNILGVIFQSRLFREQTAARQKVKTPFEFVVSTVRALRVAKPGGGYTAGTTGADLLDPLNRLGMRLFYREEPDGWPELGREWINTSALVERMRFVQTFLRAGSANSDPVGLIKLKLPSSQWRNDAAVADLFLNLLFLGEGRANLDLDRRAAIDFLNRSDSGLAVSPFRNLDPNSSGYDVRVRGMAAMLMGLPRFEEQ